MNFYKLKDFESLEKLKKRTEVALSVCERKIRDMNEVIDDEQKLVVRLISKKEWDILSADELSEETLAKKKHDDWISNLDKQKERPKKKKKTKKLKNSQDNDDDDENDNKDVDCEEEEENEQCGLDAFTLKIKQVLKEYKKRYH